MADSATPWTVACQTPLSVGFSRQEYWSELPRLPGDLSDPGIEPASPVDPALQVDSSPLSHQGSPLIEISQARILEQVVISYSRGSSQPKL